MPWSNERVSEGCVTGPALIDDGPVGQAPRVGLGRDEHWGAPDHLLIETFSSLRGTYIGHKISERRARDALDALGLAAIERVGTRPLLPRMWELRSNVSGYDAAYIAAAEAYRCPLVTADARLARIEGLRCEVRVAVRPTGRA